jgi:RNA polymerase primary sigma factor
MTSGTQPDDRGPNDRSGTLFIADFYPRLGGHLARQHESGYDAVASRARFLLWLATHAEVLPAFTAKAGQVPRLTAEEETGLAAQIQAGRRAEEKLAEDDGTRDAEARAELEQIAYDGVRAGYRLAEANLWLVVSIAERFADRGVPSQNLIREGHRGLVRAAQKYDHTKGYQFATYATWWVRQAMNRAVAGRRRVITGEELRASDIDELTTTERRMVRALGRAPTPEELAAELELSPP